MTTPVYVCGTGNWDGPVAGDPDSTNVAIYAQTVFGGVKVSWTYPAVHPEAVAHVLLYRGLNSNFSQAIQLAVVAGTSYYDQVDILPGTSVTLFYWIKVVSVHGTVGNLIGPAMAGARAIGDQTAEELTGLIHDGLLATTLREPIDRITLNYNDLMDRIAGLLSGDSDLSAAIAAVRGGVTQSLGLIHEETTIRMNGLNAMARQVDIIASLNAKNAAAIITEQETRVTKDTATATQITNILAATTIAGTIAQEAAAAIIVERNARTTQFGAAVLAVETVQTTLNQNIASVQVTAQSGITIAGAAQTTADTAHGTALLANSLAGEANSRAIAVGALWTAKLDVNGLVGGFGVYNDGREIEAGFEVDRFWIGRTADDSVLPFVVSNGVVYINKARVNTLSIEDRSASSLDSATGVDTASVTVHLKGVTGEVYDVLLMASAQMPLVGAFTLYDGLTAIVGGTGSGLNSVNGKITGAANSTHTYSMLATSAVQCTLSVFVSKR